MAGGLILLTALTGAVAVPAHIAMRDAVTVEARAVRFADVADLTLLPAKLRMRATELTIAQLGPVDRTVAFSKAALVARARALLPGLAPWLPEAVKGTISVNYHAVAIAGRPDHFCLRVLTPLPTGSSVKDADFAQTKCVGATVPAFVYDRFRRSVRTRRSLVRGDLVADYPQRDRDQIQAGQLIYLRAAVGPIIVDHAVAALQSAPVGGKLFVRTRDGDVHSIRYRGGLR